VLTVELLVLEDETVELDDEEVEDELLVDETVELLLLVLLELIVVLEDEEVDAELTVVLEDVLELLVVDVVLVLDELVEEEVEDVLEDVLLELVVDEVVIPPPYSSVTGVGGLACPPKANAAFHVPLPARSYLAVFRFEPVNQWLSVNISVVPKALPLDPPKLKALSCEPQPAR